MCMCAYRRWGAREFLAAGASEPFWHVVSSPEPTHKTGKGLVTFVGCAVSAEISQSD